MWPIGWPHNIQVTCTELRRSTLVRST